MTEQTRKQTPEEIAEERIEAARKSKATVLDLSDLGLAELPPSIGQLNQLEVLRAIDNQLMILPEVLAQLVQLQALLVYRNRLEVLPQCLGQLTQLRHLDVSNNQLIALPERIGQLMELRQLYVSGNRLAKLPEAMSQLTQLEKFSVHHNKLTAMLDIPDQLTQLQTVDASRNNLTALSEAIGLLNKLEGLYIWGNQLTSLPETLGQLTHLRYLNVSRNQLTALPASLRKLPKLEQLFLHDNPALGLPVELLGPTWDLVYYQYASQGGKTPANPASIIDYYFSKRGAERPLNEAKMLLVGRGGVGKTSLVNRLVHGRYNPKETKTDGIAITPWAVKIGQDEVRLNLWDFGGQEIMHATHQFFMTKRSLYLLVLNAREGEQDANVDYWLRLIQSFGGDSPVLIVINKAQAHAFDLNRRGLKEKFPTIRDFLQTDCESEQGLEELRRVILRETDQLDHLRDPFPASWFSVKDTLAHLREREGENFIPFARYQQLCAEEGVMEAVSQETLVGFLHDLGIVVNFRNDLRLADTHVLNPEWVTNGIYKVLNDPKLAETKGELRLEDLARVLDQQEYPRKMHLYLLDLMRKFELCYEFYDGEASSEPRRSRREEAQTSTKTEPPHVGSYRLGSGDGHYLVPELLGKEEPDLREFAGAEALRFDYRYNILPEGLLPRFIVRSRALMKKDQPRWRTGVVLEWEGNRAVVKADLQDRTVSIAVVGDGTGRRRLLTVIRADLEVIHRSITKLEATEEVPVPGQAGLAVGYEELCTFDKAGEKELTRFHKGKLVKVKIAELLNGVEEASTRPSEPMRKTGAREGVRVVFSYSHKDEELRDQLETHLKLLQRQGVISTWNDRKIIGGENWAGVIDDNFKRADLILLLVSADFIASDYCYEIEMKTALEREEKGEAKVVPVILQPCQWQKAPFGKLQALPKDGKPVAKWGNRAEALTKVADGIEKVVAELRQRGM